MRRRLAELVVRADQAAARRPGLGGAEDLSALLDLLHAEYDQYLLYDEYLDLADSFSLDELECDLLVVAAAAELDIRFGAVYAALLANPLRLRPTAGLALELCGYGSLSAHGRQRLGSGGTLQRQLLLMVEGPEPLMLQSLRVPERVVSHLLGDAGPAPELLALVVAVPGRRDSQAALIAHAVQLGTMIVHVRTRRSAAGLATARGACDLLERHALLIDLSRRPAGADPASLVQIAAREAALRRACLVLSGVDDVLPSDRTVLTVAEQAPVPVIVVDGLGWDTDWVRVPLVTVDATELTHAERAALWATAVVDASVPAQDPTAWLDLLSLKMTPQEVLASAGIAAVMAAARREPVTAGSLRRAARIQGGSRLRGPATSTVPRARLADLVLPAPARRAVEELVSWARNRDTLLEVAHLTGKGSKGRGLTAMFAGSPGTGKTLAAEAVAGELGLELYTVDLSSVIDKYIGETQKQLERVISEAENMNVVLFFDEADSLFGSRSAVGDSRDRYANQEVSYLLQRIERFEGLAILATNLRGNLDPAFIRRLHHIIAFTDPDPATRRRLWESHILQLGALDPTDPLDLTWLSDAVEVTGGDIRNIVMSAAFTAAADRPRSDLTDGQGVAVGMRHVLAAVDREYLKLGRRLPSRPP